jgi:glycosyltransferase involved in cell wall biosynthesis
MRILLIHDFPHETGGAELIVRATEKILEEEGHAALIYAPGRGSFAGAFFSISNAISVLKEIRRFKPDIVHVHNLYRNVSPSVLLAAKHRDVPIVMTIHDFQIVCPKTSLVDRNRLNCKDGYGYRCFYGNCFPRKPFDRGYQGLKALKLFLHRLIIRRTVSHFFCPSACLMEWTVRNLGVKNASLLPNFLLTDPEPSSDIPSGETILFVGKLSEQKGVDVLIRAVALVRAIIPDVRLKIVGGGPEELKLQELAACLQATDHIVFAGKMSHQQVMRQYDEALCVVIPSKYVENCSMVGVEALSRGKVIIASRIGGLTDLVDEQETGFLVQPDDPGELADKIIYIMRNRSLLHEMGERARAKYGRCFSRPTYSSALLSVYERIIHEARNRNAQL